MVGFVETLLFLDFVEEFGIATIQNIASIEKT
jgi:hypothetical protein